MTVLHSLLSSKQLRKSLLVTDVTLHRGGFGMAQGNLEVEGHTRVHVC